LQSDVNIWADLKPYLTTKKPEGSIIIYCLTRKLTEEITELLLSHGIQCGAYHAGLGLNERNQVHERFVRDQLQIIVATVAFGMGIDKPDVRLVIHYGASKDIESYYQEAGRAGRDGQPAKCVMFYSRADFKTHQVLRELSGSSVQFKKHLEELALKMHQYLNTRDCRRLYILKYFEGVNAQCEQRDNCCDNCSRKMTSMSDSEKYVELDADGKFDFSTDVTMLLKAVQAFNGKSGITLPILLLRGSQNKKIHAG
jgi:RecQ family ATP-dependent DNA helicase